MAAAAAAAGGGGESHGDATDAVAAAGAVESSCRIGAGARKAAAGTLRIDEVMVDWGEGGGALEARVQWKGVQPAALG